MKRGRRPPKSRKLILDSFKSAYITVEFGHKTVKRKEPTPEGYDHDWEVYVRGYDKVQLDEIVQKVVFNIHESYEKPRRVVKKPPYKINESGYGGFVMIIYVYFKCNDVEHREYKIPYDLTYPEDDKSVKNHTIKRISFTMPNESFLSKLRKAGATVEDTDSKIFAKGPERIKKSKDEIKNHDKTYLTKEGQKKKELTQTQQEKVRAKISKSEYALEQKPKLKKKKLNLMDYHETGNDSLLKHRSKHALNSTSKDSTTLKGMKRTTNHTSGAERKSVKLFNNALDSLITQSKDCSSDSELEDNIIKNSASNRLSIDKKYNGTVYNKKSRKKGSKKSVSKNDLLSGIYDSESDKGNKIDGAGSSNSSSDQLLMSYNINNSDNIDVKTGIHKEHINQYTSPSSLSSQKSSNSSFIEKDLIIPTDHARFTKLQRIIVSLDDDELINEIADIVYATGSYQICKESQKFQFKLEDLGLKALCRIEKLVYKDD